MRLLCSDRHSTSRCGRTFPAHWDGIIPGTLLAGAERLIVIRALAAALRFLGRRLCIGCFDYNCCRWHRG